MPQPICIFGYTRFLIQTETGSCDTYSWFSYFEKWFGSLFADKRVYSPFFLFLSLEHTHQKSKLIFESYCIGALDILSHGRLKN